MTSWVPSCPGKVCIAMADIPIHNETDYALTETMTQDILRDAQEHFGDAIRAIRVQAGLQRHAWNARTHEVVAYLLAADNAIGPLLSRLRGAQQPVGRPRHAFSAPRSHLLARL
jgi:hypothetical protein